MYEGAVEFIEYLANRFDLVIVTAIPLKYASARVQILIEVFPSLKEENIFITSRKECIHLDYLLDDGVHNLLSHEAKYTIMMRRPWNYHVTGRMSVTNYNECISLIESLQYSEDDCDTKPQIICLVGPSGSNKKALAAELNKQNSNFVRPVSWQWNSENFVRDPYYEYHSKEDILNAKKQGILLEHTVYAGNMYGIPKDNILDIVNKGKIATVPIDICGAMAIKHLYKDKCKVVFCNVPKEVSIRAILTEENSISCKTLRIMSLDEEYKNEIACDVAIDTTDVNKATSEIISWWQ